MAILARLCVARQLGLYLVLALHLAGLAACAGDQREAEATVLQDTVPNASPDPAPDTASDTASDTSSESCGRVEAASHFSLAFFHVMGEMGEDCAEGDVLACNPANYVIGGLAGVVFMPMGFVIGLAAPEIETHYCAKVRRQKAARKKPETPEEKRAKLWARAAEGDAKAQYELGEQLFEAEASGYQRAAWHWYCRAAHQRHAEAQYRLGGYYRSGLDPVSRDPLQAYLWYELAADQHVSAAADGRAEVAARLTARQIAHAERRAAEWQPKPETCGFNSVGNTALSPGEVRSDDR